MIDWIKVRKERRMKLAIISQEDVEGYLLISKLPDAQAVSIFDFPKHWQVCSVWHDPPRRAFVFAVMSPDFVPLVLGAEPETVIADRHIIEITRKAVST